MNKIFLKCGLTIIILCCVACALVSCTRVQSIELSQLSKSEFSDALSIDRPRIGLPELPNSGSAEVFYLSQFDAKNYNYDVRIELRENPHSTKITREIIFKKEGAFYKYLGEKIIAYGPNYFGDKENQFQENIMITYSIQKAWENNSLGYQIDYSGNDQHLKSKNISPEEALKIISQWNQSSKMKNKSL